ncbi:Cmx/CmrA family chloramphenicol efflux MFS transporter [Glycomyces paridis]|uniref:MFS transporter n=1 Tax=Glycomyces paridis TaxID=2126555 RepID=A0A4S8P953_9ACTN|nr:Cmx/CmrA family chloramphenicol efflux MFS transporter [Glycomyces paridis]THV26773.1 MFS transporter [Glycomyces paridis]
MPLPVYLLAVAVFAMGTSEFMLAGLLPDLAADIGVSVAAAGLLTAAFAVGMTAGAPLAAALTRTWPRRPALLAFLGLFLAAHVIGAATENFGVLLATRVAAALANAGFLAVALTAAAALAGPDRRGRALAILLSGTTIATVAGVPGGALLGGLLSWRAVFWAVALLCVPAALGLLRGLPAAAEDPPALRTELGRLRSPRLLLAMALGALVNAGTFATFTFIAPLVTHGAGLGPTWVPVALVLFGIGAFLGVNTAGRLADRSPGPVIAAGGPALLLGWCALALTAAHPVAVLTLAFILGALSFGVGATLIARVLHESSGAPTMAGAYATSALNIGAVAGPVAAAFALDAGPTGPVWTSAVLVAAALALVLAFRRTALPQRLTTCDAFTSGDLFWV